MIESLIERWRQLSARVRRSLIGALLVVAIAGGYMLLVEPAWQGREAANAQLPALRQQVAQADWLAAEAKRLSTAAASAPQTSLQAARSRIEQTLDLAGLRGSIQQIQASDALIDLRLRNIAFAQWLIWLDTTLRETRLRVVDLSVTRETEPGQVSIRLVLELAGTQRR